MRKLILLVMFLTFGCIFVFAQENVQEKQEGITFETKTATYSVEKPGATIRFTKDGVVMDGVRKIGK